MLIINNFISLPSKFPAGLKLCETFFRKVECYTPHKEVTRACARPPAQHDCAMSPPPKAHEG